MELVDKDKGIYRQRFHAVDFKLLSEVEDYERGRLAALKVRVVDTRYYIGKRDHNKTVVLLDLYFKSLINQPMTADKLFNYN